MLKFFNSMKAYIIKEFTEGIRTHKFLILAIGVLFFSIADPVLLKLTPGILQSQFQGMDISAMVDLTQKAAMDNYSKDLYQLITLILVFTLMGIIAGERTDKTLTIPVSLGCSISSVIISKTLIYGIYLILLSITGMTVAYYYSGVIFEPGYATFAAVTKAGFLYGVFFCFVISILILLSSLVKKSFIGGIGTAIIVFFMPLLGNMFSIGRYLPSHLLTEAKYFGSNTSTELMGSMICSIAIIIILNMISIIRMKNIELV